MRGGHGNDGVTSLARILFLVPDRDSRRVKIAVRLSDRIKLVATRYLLVVKIVLNLVCLPYRPSSAGAGVNMFKFFKSNFFDFEFVRVLTAAPFGGADIAECLQAAEQIKNDDPESWHRVWYAQAEKAEALAEDATRSGDFFSARRAYLRASNYFRASGYMFHDRRQRPEARVIAITQRVHENFEHAIRLLEGEVFSLEIPCDGCSLPGYLYLPPATKRLPGKIPILVNTGGADSIQEELYYVYASTGPDLGYAVLTFDGPGQGIMLRKHKQYMRPDWENVIGRVLDHLSAFSAKQPGLELDMDRIAVAGASMGGYYSLRSALDPRVKACVSIDPFYDMWDFATKHISSTFINSWTSGWVPTGLVNGTIDLAARGSFQMKWEVELAKWFFNVDTATDTLLEMKAYTFQLPDGGSYLAQLHCPVLVSGATHSLYLEPDTDTLRVYNALSQLDESQKIMWIARLPEEGGLQAKIGAIGLSAQKTFAFLDEHLGVDRPPLDV